MPDGQPWRRQDDRPKTDGTRFFTDWVLWQLIGFVLIALWSSYRWFRVSTECGKAGRPGGPNLFVGLNDHEDRRAVIEYLRTLR